MKNETENKFRSELRSFFGLIMLNLLTVSLVIGLGIVSSVTILIQRTQSGDLLVPSLALVPLGVATAACGLYWIVQTVDLTRDVADIHQAYEDLPKGEAGGVSITALMIKMAALYRANRTLIARMKALGTLGGVTFVLLGGSQIASELWTIAASSSIMDGTGDLIGALIGGSITITVGITALLTARYFSIYSKVWDARIAETAKIEDVLKQKLEGL
jgi:hypothetical protein